MIIRNDAELERLQTDGEISIEDADAIARFGAFLEDAGPPEKPNPRLHAAMHKHYPEDLQRARREAGLPEECCP